MTMTKEFIKDFEFTSSDINKDLEELIQDLIRLSELQMTDYAATELLNSLEDLELHYQEREEELEADRDEVDREWDRLEAATKGYDVDEIINMVAELDLD